MAINVPPDPTGSVTSRDDGSDLDHIRTAIMALQIYAEGRTNGRPAPPGCPEPQVARPTRRGAAGGRARQSPRRPVSAHRLTLRRTG
jgi:hypothetical protein